MKRRYFLLLVVWMATGCASTRLGYESAADYEPSDYEAPASTPREALSIESGAHLEWTQIIAGPLRGDPIARAVNERVHVVVGSTRAGLEVGVTPLGPGAQQIWIAPPPALSGALRGGDDPPSEMLGAVTIAGDSARVVATDGWALVHGRIGLRDLMWSDASVLPANGAQLIWVGRGDGGWAVIGSRIDRVGVQDWRDYVSWFVEDSATEWPQPYVLAEREPHQYGTVDASASAAGVLALATLPDGLRGYVRQNNRWHALETPFPLLRSSTVLTASLSGWLVETKTTVFPPDPQYPTMAVWIDAARQQARVLHNYPSAPDLTPLVIEDGKPLMSTDHGRQSHGADANFNLVRGTVVYDIVRDTTRDVVAATPPGIERATWSPALRIDLGGRVCMVGGAVWHPDWGQRYVDGAACLDLESLSWRWFALQLGATETKWIGSDGVSGGRGTPMCSTLGTLGEFAIVECTQRDIITIPANSEWPGRQERGRQEWTLQRVRLVGDDTVGDSLGGEEPDRRDDPTENMGYQLPESV